MTFEVQHTTYVKQCNAAIGVAEASLLQPGSAVSQAAMYTLDNGGKRVRGVLTLAVCNLLGGDVPMAESFAVAIEMVHAFSLIHDDLPCMDDDGLRRGKPACHIAFGEATALLAGDALCVAAFEAAATAPGPEAGRAAAAALLARAAGAKGMIYGQELDLWYEEHLADEEDLRCIQAHKTGALLLAAAQLGQIASGTQPSTGDPVAVYARNIGLAFQIVDDILDVTAEESVLGKPIGSDEKSGKTTFVSLNGVEAARREVAALTKQAADALCQYGDAAQFLRAFADNLAGRLY